MASPGFLSCANIIRERVQGIVRCKSRYHPDWLSVDRKDAQKARAIFFLSNSGDFMGMYWQKIICATFHIAGVFFFNLLQLLVQRTYCCRYKIGTYHVIITLCFELWHSCSYMHSSLYIVCIVTKCQKYVLFIWICHHLLLWLLSSVTELSSVHDFSWCDASWSDALRICGSD